MPEPQLNQVQKDSVKYLLRMALVGGLGGAGARAGYEMVRTGLPHAESPEPAKPLFVDIPYVAPTPVGGPIPLPQRNKPLQKPASWVEDQLVKIAPKWTPPGGRPDAQSPAEVPLAAGLAPLVGVAGGAAGFYGADALIRAAERHGARKDLDKARQEYQDAILARARERMNKTASAAQAPHVVAAIDRAYTAFVKLAEGETLIDGKPPTTSDHVARTGLAAAMPGFAFGPEAAAANVTIASIAAALGGYSGYNYFRDKEKAERVRKGVQRIERENASSIPAPLVGRLVPVSA